MLKTTQRITKPAHLACFRSAAKLVLPERFARTHTLELSDEIVLPDGHIKGTFANVTVKLAVDGTRDALYQACCSLTLKAGTSVDGEDFEETLCDMTPAELFSLQRMINGAITEAQARGDLMLEAHGGR